MPEVTLRFTNKEDAMTALRAEDYRDTLLNIKDWLESPKGVNASPQEIRAKFLNYLNLCDI